MIPDPGVSPRKSDEHRRLLAVAPRRLDLVEEVGPREAGDERLRLAEVQLLDDVAAHRVGGRGGQGDRRRIAQHAAELAQPRVVGAEIVPPLADAVGLVHGQELQAHGPDRLEKPRAAEPLGHDVDQPVARRRPCVEPGVLLGQRERAVDERDRQAQCLELIDLVLHQGDQRRDDQRQAVEHQRRATGSRGSCRRRWA